jgi:Trk K+ transport system NAD-binding subunit
MIEVPEGSPHTGRSLAELNLVNQFGVQVCGIERGHERILIPSGAERMTPGDRLFVLGTHNKIQDCRAYFDPI